jgi:hydroxymethylbilane synthase
VTDGRVDLHGLILTPDGSVAHEGWESGADPEGVGDRLGARLAALAGPGFFSGS